MNKNKSNGFFIITVMLLILAISAAVFAACGGMDFKSPSAVGGTQSGSSDYDERIAALEERVDTLQSQVSELDAALQSATATTASTTAAQPEYNEDSHTAEQGGKAQSADYGSTTKKPAAKKTTAKTKTTTTAKPKSDDNYVGWTDGWD